jgi:hypothetical protein
LYRATKIPVKIPTPPKTALAMPALSPTLRPVEPGERLGELDVVEEMSGVVGIREVVEISITEVE